VATQVVDCDRIVTDGAVVQRLERIDLVTENLLIDAGVAETARPHEHCLLIRVPFEHPCVYDLLTSFDAEGDNVGTAWAVDDDRIVSFVQSLQTIIQLHSQHGGVLADVAQTLHELEPGNDGRNVGEVQRPVFKSGIAQRFGCVEVLIRDADEQNGSAREPAFVEFRVRAPLDNHTADTGWVTEQLVEADRNEIRFDL